MTDSASALRTNHHGCRPTGRCSPRHVIVSADSDQTVPWAIANASYKKQKRNKGVTEIVKIPATGTR